MAARGDIYAPISAEAEMRRVFKEVPRDVSEIDSRSILTGLYRRAGYLTPPNARHGKRSSGGAAPPLRAVAEGSVRSTARRINRRSGSIGTATEYDER